MSSTLTLLIDDQQRQQTSACRDLFTTFDGIESRVDPQYAARADHHRRRPRDIGLCRERTTERAEEDNVTGDIDIMASNVWCYECGVFGGRAFGQFFSLIRPFFPSFLLCFFL